MTIEVERAETIHTCSAITQHQDHFGVAQGQFSVLIVGVRYQTTDLPGCQTLTPGDMVAALPRSRAKEEHTPKWSQISKQHESTIHQVSVCLFVFVLHYLSAS